MDTTREQDNSSAHSTRRTKSTTRTVDNDCYSANRPQRSPSTLKPWSNKQTCTSVTELDSLAERLHWVEKTCCDFQGWWVETKIERGVGERLATDQNAITAQFCSSISHPNEYCQEDQTSRPPSAKALGFVLGFMYCIQALYKPTGDPTVCRFGASVTNSIYCRNSLRGQQLPCLHTTLNTTLYIFHSQMCSLKQYKHWHESPVMQSSCSCNTKKKKKKFTA